MGPYSGLKIFGVMVIRNEADIIRLNVLHHLTTGLDRVLIADNGSTDDSQRVLEDLARDERVTWTSEPGTFYQSGITTALVHEAYLQGADWVVPIDADEFWWAPGGSLREVLARSRAAALQVQIVNFVQRRDQEEALPESLLQMTWRPPQQVGPVERIEELVDNQQIGFVEIYYPPKWISRASLALEIGAGNHNVDGILGPREETDGIVCLHAPLRARSVLAMQVDHGRRVEAAGNQKAWHVRRWRRVAEEQGLDTEWAANSYDHAGCLTVGGSPRQLVRDTRLRDLVAPLLESSWKESELGHGGGRPEPLHLLAWNPREMASWHSATRSTPDWRVHVGRAPRDEILASLRGVEGWLAEPEAELLISAVERAAELDAPALVEVGSYCGRSTIALAGAAKSTSSAAMVYAIDPHEGEVGAADSYIGLDMTAPTLERMRANLRAAGVEDRVVIVQARSYKVAWDKRIALLFIDGLHDYENVSRDFEHFSRWIVPGGLVAFDDFDSAFPGVVTKVGEALHAAGYRWLERQGKVVLLQKLSDADHGRAGQLPPIGLPGPGGEAPSEGYVAGRSDPPLLSDPRDVACRLASQERGIAFARGYYAEECAALHRAVLDRDDAITWLQSEMHRRVRQRDEEIAVLQQQLHSQIAERNLTIARLQKMLQETNAVLSPDAEGRPDAG